MTDETSADAQALSATPPLATADPQSLDSLFSRDPFGLADQDIAEIVQELRRQRAQFKAAEASGKPPPRQAKGKPAPAELSIEDLL